MIIHRAPLGTHERFCAFLIEHYGGVFPTWLAPVQIRLIPVAPVYFAYAEKLEEQLKERFVRAESDLSNDSFGKKIRNGSVSKVPNLLILGEQERVKKAVTWQRYGSKERQELGFENFLNLIVDEIRTRTDWRQEGV